MDIKKLYMAQEGAKPLYTLCNGTRYKYLNSHENEEYTFVKHCEFEFPAHFILKNKAVKIYSYNVALPDSEAYKVIFVDETSIVKVLDFL